MRFSTCAIVSAVQLLAAAEKTGRTFAVNHIQGNGLVYGRMDPIISPGQTSAHVHMVTGGNGFSTKMADTDALDSTCTNSLIKNDGSNYWVPMLYYNKGDNFTSVPMFYMNVYYFFEATDDNITSFEPGFRMLSGNPYIRTPPPTGGASILDPAQGPIQPIQFTCPTQNSNEPRYPANSNGLVGGVGMQDPNNLGAGAGFPNVECDGYASPLRMDVHFPSCYNPNAALDDYQHNTAWPSSEGASQGGYQNCPKGWVHLPHLFYEVYWNTPLFKDDWTQGGDSQPFVLAPGDPTGYASHGDFFSGWDKNTLQTIIDTCNAGDDGMDKCPQIPGGLNTPEEASSCKITAPLSEQVLGTMSQLPGCNPIQPAGKSASPNPPGCPATSAAPSTPTDPVTSSAGVAPIPTYSYSYSGTSARLVTTAGAGSGSSSSAPASEPTAATSSSSSLSASASVPTSAATVPSSSSAESAISTSDASSTLPGSVPASSAATSTGTGASPSSTAAAGNAAPSGWTYAGCFTDSKSARVLSSATENLLTSMTVEKCTDFCTSSGYSVAGLEWKSECYCGTSVPTSSSDACTDPCVGDSSSMCGGWNAISVFTQNTQSKRHALHMSAHARRQIHAA